MNTILNAIRNTDYYLFRQINQFAGKNTFFDSVAIFFADYFEYFVVCILLVFLIINFKKYLKMVFEALAAGILARFGVVELIRFLHPRPRPFINNNINLILDKVNQWSFPSGHAAFFFALATVIYFYNRKLGILFFLTAFFISICRVFVGVHWPSDILGGAIVGILTGWLIFKISKRFNKK